MNRRIMKSQSRWVNRMFNKIRVTTIRYTSISIEHARHLRVETKHGNRIRNVERIAEADSANENKTRNCIKEVKT